MLSGEDTSPIKSTPRSNISLYVIKAINKSKHGLGVVNLCKDIIINIVAGERKSKYLCKKSEKWWGG